MRIIVERSRGRSINMLLIVQYELLMHIYHRNKKLINGHTDTIICINRFSPNFIMMGKLTFPTQSVSLLLTAVARKQAPRRKDNYDPSCSSNF